ncbi:MAG: 2Fe-2S iron-sulfur cluster-binding protein [Xanthobacteraceae bacterium]
MTTDSPPRSGAAVRAELPPDLSGRIILAVQRALTIRNLRLASGLVLLAYLTLHMVNHALGLISLGAAEAGLEYAVEIWSNPLGTLLLYGAAAVHFMLALWSVYERRTFRLPPLELLRIALGFTFPLLLISHAANTRLAYDVFGLSSDYTRVVANLWVSDSQGLQLGLLAPGWLHGCLGLHLAFNRRPLYRYLRFALFAFALLLPVFSGLGFIAMVKELSTNAVATAAAADYFSPAHAPERLALAQWRNGLLFAYFSIVGAAFGARAIRNGYERGRKRLIAISYPGRSVHVPRGWSVLEASRAFHIAHASMCGGRARCSTCRVRVIAGEANVPQASVEERATLERVGAPDDVRLGCQLRPVGDISVVPLVRTERPIYRSRAPERSAERELVMLVCDFRNRVELGREHLPQDILYVLTLYVDALGKAIRNASGMLSYVEPDSICALFGLDRPLGEAARQALEAAGVIDRLLVNLNQRLGREWDCTVDVAISIDAGRAVVGEIGSSDPPTLMAMGEVADVVAALRKAATADGAFAFSERAYVAAGLAVPRDGRIVIRVHDEAVAAVLSSAPPEVPGKASPHAERSPLLQRIWGG